MIARLLRQLLLGDLPATAPELFDGKLAAASVSAAILEEPVSDTNAHHQPARSIHGAGVGPCAGGPGSCRPGVTADPGCPPLQSERAASLETLSRSLAYACFRSNVDWAREAAECGHPSCGGDCQYIRMIRWAVERIDGGILPAPEVVAS